MWTITNCDVGVFHKICFPISWTLKQPMSATAVQDKHCLKAESQQITIAGLLKCRAHTSHSENLPFDTFFSGDVFIAGPTKKRMDAGQ